MEIPSSFDPIEAPFQKPSVLYAPVKRLFDIVFAILFIVVFSPIYIVVAIAIFVQDWHSPFYSQIRVGKDKKEFRFFKFRSMILLTIPASYGVTFYKKQLYQDHLTTR